MHLYNTGVVIGKFMPPHKGHEYMIRFAKQYAKQLFVIVDCLEGQTIDSELRATWLREEIAGITVIALKENMPQDPSETPQFWSIWRSAIINSIVEAGGSAPDVLIAAMDYGWELSQKINCEFVQIDIARESFPVSATMLRNDIYEKWDFLIDSARPHFLKKVCFFGPESTGKSTTAVNIAAHYNTIYVPEYAKAVIKSQHGSFFEHNVEDVMVAQQNSENALAKFANRFLVCDTDPLTTLMWCHELFGIEPEHLVNKVANLHYDMTFVFDVDVPFVDDVHRHVLPDAQNMIIRKKFMEKSIAYLQRFNRPYMIVSGTYQNRFENIVHYIDNNLFKI